MAKPGTARDRPDARGDRHVAFGRTTWLGAGCPDGKQMERRDLTRWRGAAGVRARIVPQRREAAESPDSKAVPREGGQEDGCAMSGWEQTEAPPVPARATQGAEARNWSWVEAYVWTERMVSAWRTASRRTLVQSDGSTIRAEPSHSSPMLGCSHFTQPSKRETLPMRKPSTGEPYAGKPPVRFGGRGGKPSRPLSS